MGEHGPVQVRLDVGDVRLIHVDLHDRVFLFELLSRLVLRVEDRSRGPHRQLHFGVFVVHI